MNFFLRKKCILGVIIVCALAKISVDAVGFEDSFFLQRMRWTGPAGASFSSGLRAEFEHTGQRWRGFSDNSSGQNLVEFSRDEMDLAAIAMEQLLQSSRAPELSQNDRLRVQQCAGALTETPVQVPAVCTLPLTGRESQVDFRQIRQTIIDAAARVVFHGAAAALPAPYCEIRASRACTDLVRNPGQEGRDFIRTERGSPRVSASAIAQDLQRVLHGEIENYARQGVGQQRLRQYAATIRRLRAENQRLRALAANCTPISSRNATSRNPAPADPPPNQPDSTLGY